MKPRRIQSGFKRNGGRVVHSSKDHSTVKSLSLLKKGQRGKIVHINTKDRSMLRKLMAMGILPGLTITLIQKFPSYVFQIGASQFAIDKKMAEQIEVRPII